ncbi:MAG: methyl-accepting chemotaxis protein [Desulfobacterales bacterium]|jgi:methyl-accepting chemotaxis protein
MKRKNNQRKLKNYLVANKSQLKIAFANLLLLGFVLVVIIFIILTPFYHDIFLMNDLSSQNYSAKFFIVLLDRSSFAFIAILLIAFIHNILANHKLCGPLVNFSNTFKKIAQGDLTRKVFLRRYDFLKTEAHQINEMIDFLSDHITAIKKDNDRLLSVLKEVDTGKMEKNKYENALNTVKKQANLCNEHLSKFKIDGINNPERHHEPDA